MIVDNNRIYSYSDPSAVRRSPFVDPKMIQFLIQQGMNRDQVLSSVAELKKPSAGEELVKKGFYEDHFKFGDKTIDQFTIGDAHPGAYGQTAAIMSDGTVTLTTFAGAYTQIITMDKKGIVTENHYT